MRLLALLLFCACQATPEAPPERTDTDTPPSTLCADQDQDDVCDTDDLCPGEDDLLDTDADSLPDCLDLCPLDNPDDSDADGVCDTDDLCPGEDDLLDTDADSLPDCLDLCPLDNPDDSDADGVCDTDDLCPGEDDLLDADADGVPDPCDNCPQTSNPSQDDGDGDGVGDACECLATEVDGRRVHGTASPLVDIDPQCGKLTYGWFATTGQVNAEHLVPDYSHAGYRGGGVAIPDAPVAVVLSAQPGDNHAAIQAAIDTVEALPLDADGFRGAVLLNAGTYEVSDTLTIEADGVVLRGQGQGASGTVLVATATYQHDLIVADSGFNVLGEVGGSRVAITSATVPIGANSFEVSDATGFAVGDVIGVERQPNQLWIDDLEMGQWGWTTSSYAIVQERRITEIAGNTLTVDIPIVDPIESVYGGGEVFVADVSDRFQQVGIEDLRLESAYAATDDEDHGWNAVLLDGVENSWVARVTAVHFGFSAVTLRDAAFNTVEEVAQLDPISQITGGRRYSFNVEGDSTGNLFQRCYAREGRHNFVTGSRVPGPNVWLDCVAVQGNSDEGPHHRWATGMLLDNLWSQTVYVQNRADLGTGHGWAGNATMFYNLTALGNLVCDAPLGGMNFVVGGVGAQAESVVTPDEADGWWESHPGAVLPRSLYLAQLEDRLGAAAVAAVTVPEQLTGDLSALLNGWAGEGELATAVPVPPFDPGGIVSSNGDVACADSCGWCGGSGCGSLPGGSSNCCSGTILTAGLSCLTNPPPCVMP